MDRRTAHALDQALFLARLLRGAFIVIGLFWLYLLWHDYRGAARAARRRAAAGAGGDRAARRGRPVPLAAPGAARQRDRLAEPHPPAPAGADPRPPGGARSEVEEHGHYLRITNQILQQIGENAPLSSILDQLMLSIEERHPDTYRFDPAGQRGRPRAAPRRRAEHAAVLEPGDRPPADRRGRRLLRHRCLPRRTGDRRERRHPSVLGHRARTRRPRRSRRLAGRSRSRTATAARSAPSPSTIAARPRPPPRRSS